MNYEILKYKFEFAIKNNDIKILKEALSIKNKDSYHLFQYYLNICATKCSLKMFKTFLKDPRVNKNRVLPDTLNMACQYGNKNIIFFILNNYQLVFQKSIKNSRKLTDCWLIASERFFSLSLKMFKISYIKKIIDKYSPPLFEQHPSVKTLYKKHKQALIVENF